jgi:hypothetical protein
MARAPRGKAKSGPKNRPKKTPRRAPARGGRAANFATLAAAALRRGEPDAIPDDLLRKTLAAAVKVYAAKAERRGGALAPFADGEVTATESVVAACALIRAADLNMFDVAMWFHRAPG